MIEERAVTEEQTGLSVLAVDDEKPALEELAYLLGADSRVATIRTANGEIGRAHV